MTYDVHAAAIEIVATPKPMEERAAIEWYEARLRAAYEAGRQAERESAALDQAIRDFAS